MKKIYLALFAIVSICVSAMAQIPNYSFENWTGANPDNWSTANPYTPGVTTASKGTTAPVPAGSAYLRLISQNAPSLGRVVPGMAFSGTIVLNLANGEMTPKSGFAFTQRPQALIGQWQYMSSSPNDVGVIVVLLTKWNTSANKRDTVAYANYNLAGMAMSWTPFSIPLNYALSTNPDSASILISASNPANPAVNSYLYIDNLAFVGSVSGIAKEFANVENLLVYPNPARDKIVLELIATKPQALEMQLTDIMGKVVKNVHSGQVSGAYRQELQTTELAKGVYFLKIRADKSTETRRILIE